MGRPYQLPCTAEHLLALLRPRFCKMSRSDAENDRLCVTVIEYPSGIGRGLESLPGLKVSAIATCRETITYFDARMVSTIVPCMIRAAVVKV